MPSDVKTPVFDERAHLQGQPGLHALIAGVSGYPFLPTSGGNDAGPPQAFGMRQLTSTSLTAYKVYQWLIAHKDKFSVPLATCRVLLSPSATELAAKPQLQGFPPCTDNNFLQAAAAWRADASTRSDAMTFFYFAGHGIERSKGDAVLLLEEFGDSIGGALRHGVDMYNIYYGMSSPETGSTIAQTQLYFVDACRNLPKAITNFAQQATTTTAVFNVRLAGEDKRSAPIFYAAAPGTQAQAVPGDQTLFSKALLDCLDGDAAVFKDINGQDRWHVSVHSLNSALRMKVDDWNMKLGAAQYYTPDGQQIDAPISFVDQPPSVEVVLEVEPLDALQFAHVEVYDESGTALDGIPWPLEPYPFRAKWRAGFYTIGATIEPPDPRYVNYPKRPGLLLPPRITRKVKVTP